MTDPGQRNTPGPLQVFTAFFGLGLSAFGGPAMVAYIRRLAVHDRDWLSDETFTQGVGICQMIPGATAMQAAAYAGLRAGGAATALAAYIGFALPAFFLMLALATLYRHTRDIPAILSLFSGLQVIVVALVANATLDFGRQYLRSARDVFLGLATAVFLFEGGNPVLAILVAFLAGQVLYRELIPAHELTRAAAIRYPDLRPPLFGLVLTGLVLLALFVMNQDLFTLATLMLKIDLFAFGGGYASVPLLAHELVDVHHWLASQTLMDGIALGQVTPGPIVITATFAGTLIAGIPGALVATAAMFTPSFIILLLAVPVYDRIRNNPLMQRGLRAILVTFVGLLFSVTLHFGLEAPREPAALLIGLAAFVALYRKINILWVVLAGGAAAILLL